MRDAMDPRDLEEKLRRLRSAVRRVNWGRGPDILGVCEVETGELVRGLVDDGYRIVFHKGTYRRGNNTALATRLPLDGEPEFLDPGTTGRTILHVRLRWGQERLHVFVVHLKSKYNLATDTLGTRADEELRSKEALFLRDRVTRILEKEPAADVLLMGDFNEHYRDSVYRRELLAEEHRRGDRIPEAGDDDHRLRNLGAALQQSFRAGGTYYRHPDWSIVDNFLVSESLLQEGGVETSAFEAHIGVSWDLLDRYGQPSHFKRELPTCASDHLPVLLRLRR
jgi:endonuclease/exonuclease/phosphatase family metal-dependent hydrolase